MWGLAEKASCRWAWKASVCEVDAHLFWRTYVTTVFLRPPVSDPWMLVVKDRPKNPKNKTKPRRGLDLEEVRRRTSLLSGASSAPVPTTSHQAAKAAPRPAVASSYFDAGWGRQDAPPPSSEVPHPLHAAAAAPAPVEAEGNYFNEEFLRAREQEGRESGRVLKQGMQQGPRGGDRLMDSAGSFLTTARSVMLIVRKRKGIG